MNVMTRQPASPDKELEYCGPCISCRQVHRLPAGNAKQHCLRLMRLLEKHKRLDFFSAAPLNHLLSTDSLFGTARGKMFGILEGIDNRGNLITLHAFSGQYNGYWDIPGWAPPLFDTSSWQAVNEPAERHIKELSRQLDDRTLPPPIRRKIKARRKELSQRLMAKLHSLYMIKNFHGQMVPLTSLYTDKQGTPTGAGDCCAPKLLNYAMLKKITPLGMAEFYWGKTNPSGSRRHGHFYPACAGKCRPLLAFMLCGLNEQRRSRNLLS